MNIVFMEGFLEAARLKSLSKASDKLRISHPALSKQIRALEAYYGVELFHRSSTGVTLTENGQLLYNRILPVFTELQAIRKDLLVAGGSRRYTIGALPSLASHYLPEIVLALESGGIRVDLVIRDTSDELEKLLSQGELHAAVMERQAHHAAHWGVKLFEEPYDTVVYAGHRFAGMPSVSIREVGSEPLILNPPNCTTRRLFSSLIEEYGMKPFIKSEVQFGDFILGYVAAGAGITFAPRMAAERLANAGLAGVPIDDPRAKRTISLVCLSDRIGKALRPYFLSSQRRSAYSK